MTDTNKLFTEKLNKVIVLLYSLMVISVLNDSSMMVLEKGPVWKFFWGAVPVMLMVCVCVKLYLNINNTLKYVLPVCLCFALSFAMRYNGGRDIYTLIVLMAGAYGICFDDFVFAFLYVSLPYKLIMTICSQTNVVSDLVYGGIRHSLGSQVYVDYVGPITCMLLAYIYLHRNKKRFWIESVVFAALAFIIYRVTLCRTDFALMVLVIALILLDSALSYVPAVQKGLRRIGGIVSFLVLPVLLLFTFTIPLMYDVDSHLEEKIPALTSSVERIKLMQEAFATYPVTIFGTAIELKGFVGNTWIEQTVNSGYSELDNSYVNWFFTGGIAALVLLVAALEFATFIAWKKKNYWLTVMIVVLEIQNFMELGYGQLHRDLLFLIPFAAVPAVSPYFNNRKLKPFIKRIKITLSNYKWPAIAYAVLTVILIGVSLIKTDYGYQDMDLESTVGIPLETDSRVRQEFNTMAMYRGISLAIDTPDGGSQGSVFLEIGDRETGEILVSTQIDLAGVQDCGMNDIIFDHGQVLPEGRELYMELWLDGTSGACASILTGNNDRTDYVLELMPTADFTDDVSGKAVIFSMMYKYNSEAFAAWIMLTCIFTAYMYMAMRGNRIILTDDEAGERQSLHDIMNLPSLGMMRHLSLHGRMLAYLIPTFLLLIGTGLIWKETFQDEGVVYDYQDEKTEGFRINENNCYFQYFALEQPNLKEIRIYLEKYSGAEMDSITVGIDDADMNVLYQESFDNLEMIPGMAVTLDVEQLRKSGQLELEEGKDYVLGIFAVHNEELETPTLMQITFFYKSGINYVRFGIGAGILIVLLLLCVIPMPEFRCVRVSPGARNILFAVAAVLETAVIYLVSGAENGYLSVTNAKASFEPSTNVYPSSWMARQEAIMAGAYGSDSPAVLWYRIVILVVVAVVMFFVWHMIWKLDIPHHRIMVITMFISIAAGFILNRFVPYSYGGYITFSVFTGICLAAFSLLICAHLRVRNRDEQHEAYAKLTSGRNAKKKHRRNKKR